LLGLVAHTPPAVLVCLFAVQTALFALVHPFCLSGLMPLETKNRQPLVIAIDDMDARINPSLPCCYISVVGQPSVGATNTFRGRLGYVSLNKILWDFVGFVNEL